MFPTTILIEMMSGQTLRMGWDRGQVILSLLRSGGIEGEEARVSVSFCQQEFRVYPADILPFDNWELLVQKYRQSG